MCKFSMLLLVPQHVPWTGEEIIESGDIKSVLVLLVDSDVGTIPCSCYGTKTKRLPAP